MPTYKAVVLEYDWLMHAYLPPDFIYERNTELKLGEITDYEEIICVPLLVFMPSLLWNPDINKSGGRVWFEIGWICDFTGYLIIWENWQI